jgi:glycine cleavage system H protein
VHPDDLQYTAEHEWVRTNGATVRIGITDYAQQQLGDVVFVSLPEVGATLAAGDPCGEVESTKSVSDIYAPVGGVVVARNETLDQHPDQLNTDPYGDGWLFEIESAEPAASGSLLDAAAYRAQIGE